MSGPLDLAQGLGITAPLSPEQIEALPEPDELPLNEPAWTITDRSGAVWACGNLAKALKQKQAVQAQSDEWRNRISQWELAELRRLRVEGRISFFTRRLEIFTEAWRAEDPQHNRTLSLPNGSVASVQHRPAVEITDEAAVLAWAKADHPDLVQTVEKVPVSAVKGAVEIKELEDGEWVVIDPSTGAEVDGLGVRPAWIGFSVRPEVS